MSRLRDRCSSLASRFASGLALSLALVSACAPPPTAAPAAARAPAVPPACPAAPAGEAWARALVAADARAGRAIAADARAWATLLAAGEVRGRAAEAAGSAFGAGDVRVEALASGELALEVRGDGAQAAVARCLALLRAASEVPDESGAAVLALLRDQRLRLRTELAAIEGELAGAALPADPSDAATIAEAARRTDDLIAALRRADRAAGDPVAPGTEALAALEAEHAAAARAAEELARVYGPNHPELRAALERAASLAAELDAQIRAELAWLRAYREALSAEVAARRRGRGRVADERLGLERAYLLTTEATLGAAAGAPAAAGAGSSFAPRAFRLRAVERRQRAHLLAELALRYGERHPRLVAARAALAEAGDALEAERSRQVELARARRVELARPDTAAGLASARALEAAARARRADFLRAALVGVDDRIAEHEAAVAAAPFTVRAPCATP